MRKHRGPLSPLDVNTTMLGRTPAKQDKLATMPALLREIAAALQQFQLPFNNPLGCDLEMMSISTPT